MWVFDVWLLLYIPFRVYIIKLTNYLMHVTSWFLNVDKYTFKIYWLRATEGPTQDKNHVLDFGWILLEKKTTFISVINCIILQGVYVRKGIFKILEFFSYLGFFNFLSG